MYLYTSFLFYCKIIRFENKCAIVKTTDLFEEITIYKAKLTLILCVCVCVCQEHMHFVNYLFACTTVRMHACMHVRIYVCAHLSIGTYACTHGDMYAFMHVRI